MSTSIQPAPRIAALTWRAPLTIASVLCAEAGCVHLLYTPNHWLEWWVLGALFLAAAVGQLLLAPVLLRWPHPSVLVGAVAMNLAIVVFYFLSRTQGLPFGPHAHVLEPAAPLDLATTAGEVAVIVILLGQLRGVTRRLIVNLLLAAAAVAWGLRLTGHLG